MGGGESSVIVLLSRLQAIPVGGLLVIEEVELGLHVEAQVRLMEVLLSYCSDRRLQIICTSHSEAVIDAVPRRARVLLRKNGQEHEALNNVSTRFAVHEMTGHAQPELIVYTEDKLASMVVDMLADDAAGAREVLSKAKRPLTRRGYLELQRKMARREVYEGR